MMPRDERLRYLEKLDTAKAKILSDPEVALEYAEASHAWDSAIQPALTDVVEEKSASRPTQTDQS